MKRKKKIRLAITIAIIVVIIVGLKIITQPKKDEIKRLVLLYEELDSSQTYLFEMQEKNNNKTIMAKKGDKTIIDNYSENNHTTTIVKDNNTYLVLHDREEYYIYEQNNVQQTILSDGLEEIINKDFTSGKERVKGKKYTYEEYAGSTMFMSENNLDTDEQQIRTRFYFDDDNNLVYIQTINGSYQELLKVNLQNEVDDSIFEIPANYAEN